MRLARGISRVENFPVSLSRVPLLPNENAFNDRCEDYEEHHWIRSGTLQKQAVYRGDTLFPDLDLHSFPLQCSKDDHDLERKYPCGRYASDHRLDTSIHQTEVLTDITQLKTLCHAPRNFVASIFSRRRLFPKAWVLTRMLLLQRFPVETDLSKTLKDSTVIKRSDFSKVRLE